MDEGKVGFVVGVDQVMVILVDLHRRELALVYDVLVGQGAYVEPVVKANGVRGPLAQHVQLPLKQAVVKFLGVGVFGRISGAVGGGEDNKGLRDNRLSRLRGGAEQTGINGRLPPSQDTKAQRFGNIFQLPLGLGKSLFVGLKEQVSHCILTQRR